MEYDNSRSVYWIVVGAGIGFKDNLPFSSWRRRGGYVRFKFGVSFYDRSPILFFLNGKWKMENGKWQMKNDFRFLGGLAFSAKRTNRFERFTVFKPPALPEVSDCPSSGEVELPISNTNRHYRILLSYGITLITNR
jgi:hypothetical protein